MARHTQAAGFGNAFGQVHASIQRAGLVAADYRDAASGHGLRLIRFSLRYPRMIQKRLLLFHPFEGSAGAADADQDLACTRNIVPDAYCRDDTDTF